MLKRFFSAVFVIGLCAAGLRAQQQFSLLATILDPATRSCAPSTCRS